MTSIPGAKYETEAFKNARRHFPEYESSYRSLDLPWKSLTEGSGKMWSAMHVMFTWSRAHLWCWIWTRRGGTGTRTGLNRFRRDEKEASFQSVRKNQHSSFETVIFFLKWASFLPTFVLLHTLKFLQQINVNKCPSSIQCRDSNSRPLQHESHPIITRPGLPHLETLILDRVFSTIVQCKKYLKQYANRKMNQYERKRENKFSKDRQDRALKRQYIRRQTT